MDTSITHPKTSIEIADKVPMATITREFDAPITKLFRAHAEADIYARWIGPRGLTTTITRWDLATGGAWRMEQADADGNVYGFYGSFHEVRPDALIVQTFTFEGFPDGVSLDRVAFEALPDGRSRLVATSLMESVEALQAMVDGGMEQGVVEGYEKLDEALAAM